MSLNSTSEIRSTSSGVDELLYFESEEDFIILAARFGGGTTRRACMARCAKETSDKGRPLPVPYCAPLFVTDDIFVDEAEVDRVTSGGELLFVAEALSTIGTSSDSLMFSFSSCKP